MKIIYVTDIHGVKWKYESIFDEAIANKVDIVINGGDLFPTRPSFFIQDEFIVNFLEGYMKKFEQEGIFHLFQPANDDLAMHDELLQKVTGKFEFNRTIAQKKTKIQDYEFIGFNFVTDLPFGLKDRARMDIPDFEFQKQIGKPLISTKDGLKEINNWFSYARSLPTIEEELEKLSKPDFMKKTVYVMHMPPAKVSLDVCSDARCVGSFAIYNFIKKNQPLLTLHGHIHESPQISNKWMNNIGKTICIQPGQSNYYQKFLNYVIIDLKKMEYEHYSIEKQK
ncbi:MAG: phosphoesterase [Promethearchaeota archaeon]|nr:MAG: phosphoesterase [Candidatus Lokiarchaeota archaeon]